MMSAWSCRCYPDRHFVSLGLLTLLLGIRWPAVKSESTLINAAGRAPRMTFVLIGIATSIWWCCFLYQLRVNSVDHAIEQQLEGLFFCCSHSGFRIMPLLTLIFSYKLSFISRGLRYLGNNSLQSQRMISRKRRLPLLPPANSLICRIKLCADN